MPSKVAGTNRIYRLTAATFLTLLGPHYGFTFPSRVPHHSSLFSGASIGLPGSHSSPPSNANLTPSISIKSNNVSPILTNKPGVVSPAAKWHAKRRREMIKYHPQLRKLESARSLSLTLPLLIAGNLGLFCLSLFSASLPFHQLFLLAATAGATLSLWQLQILHECLHGSMLGANTALHKKWHRTILFFGSMPSAFGYWLYLRFGHLSHHRSLGAHSLNDAFTSPSMDLSDGDVLFVNHRMNMTGDAGPQISIGGRDGSTQTTVTMAIGRSGFSFWKRGRSVRNALIFAASFLLERCLLIVNDVVVAITGRNYFFSKKPDDFHRHCALYARVAVAVRVGLMTISKSWNPLLFLILSETLWSLPPHPACAMFVTNHGCDEDHNPTSSTYSGKWYSVLTLGTNYHCEHHDFPTMPLHKLGQVRKIVGDKWYKTTSDDDLGRVMKKAFGEPDFYACMDVGVKEIDKAAV